MTIRLKNRLGEFLRFIRYLPRIYRSHVLATQQRFHGVNQHHVLFFDRKNYIYAPNDVGTFHTWQTFFAEPSCAAEVQQFLKLRMGCQRFLDIGAAQGLFSALFARSAVNPGQILGVEPTETNVTIYKETMKLNSGHEITWSVKKAALMDKENETQLADPAFDGFFQQFAAEIDNSQTVFVTTLDRLCKQAGFSPDLIKMDVDGFEYDILMGSPDFLQEYRPKMHLEFHFADIRRRGKDPAKLLHLIKQSHRVASSVPGNYLQAEVARLSLVPH